jgi:hypothetical protein
MARGDLIITQSGEGGVAQSIAAQLERIKNRAEIALAIEANVIKVDAQRRCPVDTTAAGARRRSRKGLPHLRDTAFVAQVQRGRNAGLFRVGFRHPAAKFVNYDQNKNHPTGRALFLTDAMNYAKRGMVQRVATAARVG